MAKVSIIIPCYNCAPYIQETLISIQNQVFEDWECILVNDGSTDNTEEVIQSYISKDSRTRLYNNAGNIKNAAAARNYGYQFAKGKYIQFFDADDIMHAHHLLQKVEVLESNPDCDFTVCQTASFQDNIENITYKWENIFSDNLLEDHFCGNINFLTPGPMFRNEFLKQYPGLYNYQLYTKEEWDLFSRMLVNKPTVIPIYEILIYYRVNPTGITGTAFLTEKNILNQVKAYFAGSDNMVRMNVFSPKMKKFIRLRMLHYIFVSLEGKHFKLLPQIMYFMNKLLFNNRLTCSFYVLFKVMAKLLKGLIKTTQK